MGLFELFDRKLAVGGELDGISTLEVVMRPAEVFVRPLSHEEALRLKRLVKRSKHASTRGARHRNIELAAVLFEGPRVAPLDAAPVRHVPLSGRAAGKLPNSGLRLAHPGLRLPPNATVRDSASLIYSTTKIVFARSV